MDDNTCSHDPFESNLPVIREALACVLRRRQLPREDCEDFAGDVMLRLLENDREVLRKYEGRSSLRTFLVAVIERILLDFRIARWGKWRASAEARRLGTIAVALERLLSRDGHSFEEACALMPSVTRHTVSVSALSAIRMRLPARTRRRFLTEAALDDLTLDGPAPELGLLRTHAVRTLRVLRRSFARLSENDRTLMRLRFAEGRSVAEIARWLGIEQKTLYRIFDGLLRRLRIELERENINARDVRSWLGQLDSVSPSSRTTRALSSARIC